MIQDDLRGLHARLSTGVIEAALQSRSEDRVKNDIHHLQEKQLTDIVQKLFHAVNNSPTTKKINQLLGELAGVLHEERMLFSVLFSTARTLGDMPRAERYRVASVHHWMAISWLAEAAWLVVSTETAPRSALLSGNRKLLYPLAARLRFLALSEPLRHRPADVASAWGPDDDSEHGWTGRVFGVDSWTVLIDRCREARRIWQTCLDSYQSHPYLATATPDELEHELAQLIFIDAHSRRPLTLGVRPLSETAGLDAEDRAIVTSVTDRHLLPRFHLGPVIALGCADLTIARTRRRTTQRPRSLRRNRTEGNGRRSAESRNPASLPRPPRITRTATPCLRRIVAAGVIAAALATAVSTALDAAWPVGIRLALATYALIGIGVTVFGWLWAAMWLLRLPAASAVGFFILISLPEDWWRRLLTVSSCERVTPSRTAVGILMLISYGYLLLVARKHGVAPFTALYRSAVVWGIAVVHAFLVSVICLGGVAPAFTAKGAELMTLLQTTGTAGAWGVLLLATSWCLAVGVISQILWQDRAITAPLSHLTWRAGR